MSDSKQSFSPGPWECETKKGPHNVEGTVSSIGIYSAAKFSALMEDDDANEEDALGDSWVCGIWGAITEEDEADARLIAAAPDLLSCLIDCREACLFDDDNGGIGVSEDVVISHELFDRICAAIAKAGG